MAVPNLIGLRGVADRPLTPRGAGAVPGLGRRQRLEGFDPIETRAERAHARLANIRAALWASSTGFASDTRASAPSPCPEDPRSVQPRETPPDPHLSRGVSRLP
jgi:hypothetical protein